MLRTVILTLACALAFVPSSAPAAESVTVYSGRSKTLVAPLIEKFTQASGIQVNIRYGDSAEMAATILEEGSNSPADIFFAQDAGSLGALAAAGVLAPLPESILSRVEPRFRSPAGLWVGTSGRARVVVYNTSLVPEAELPSSILAFADPKWKGKLGWSPTNGSFQAFVTALRTQLGEAKAAEWLRAVKANDPKVYPNNSAIVAAAGAGEIHAGFVNHYYLFRFLQEKGEGFGARNHFLAKGDPGALVNVAGLALLKGSKAQANALKFAEFILSPEAQQFFAKNDFEYPLAAGAAADPRLKPMAEIETPDLDLGKLSDLQGTLKLLRETGVLE